MLRICECHEVGSRVTTFAVSTGVKFDTTLEIFNSDSLFNLPGGSIFRAACVLYVHTPPFPCFGSQVAPVRTMSSPLNVAKLSVEDGLDLHAGYLDNLAVSRQAG